MPLVRTHYLYFLSVVCFFASGIVHQGRASDIQFDLSLDRKYHQSGIEQGVYTRATIRSSELSDESNEVLQLNLCLVIDRSGSMAGPRMQAVKRALSHTLDSLSQNDIASIITYGSEVETLVPAQRIDGLANITPTIEAIEAIGGSALYDAINQGAAQLRRHRSTQTVNRMIILSDGEPTKGPREIEDFSSLAKTLANEGITLSAIGLGDAFSEDLMATIATQGGGVFYFLQDRGKLADTFAADIAPLSAVVARDVVLQLKFSRQVEIEESLGKFADIERSTATFRWNQLYENTETQALISATIRASATFFSSAKIVTATLSYLPASNGFSERVTIEKIGKTQFTQSKDLSLDSRYPETIRAALSLEIAASIREAIQLSDEGKPEKGLRKIRRTISGLKRVNYTLEDPVIDDQIQTLQRTYDRIKAEGLNRIDRKTLTARMAVVESNRKTVDASDDQTSIEEE